MFPSLWVWLSGSANVALEQVCAHSHIISAVSLGFGSMDAGGHFSGSANATLVRSIKQHGIEVHGLMSIASMRTLRTVTGCTFRGCPTSPEPALTAFIDAAVSAAVVQNMSGINLDFEPYGDASLTNADGVIYAYFVEYLALALHAASKVLTLDYFTNLPVWNLALLNGTSVDRLISMDTYAQQNATFEAYLAVANAYVDPQRLGLGMCAARGPGTPFGPNPCGAQPWTESMIAERFAFLRTAASAGRFSQLNMWVLPLSDTWWRALEGFYSQG